MEVKSRLHHLKQKMGLKQQISKEEELLKVSSFACPSRLPALI
jgi:hypothetical protein